MRHVRSRLDCGRGGECLARYDTEARNGHHVHYGETEQSYRFAGLEMLLEKFLADVDRLTGGNHGKT